MGTKESRSSCFGGGGIIDKKYKMTQGKRREEEKQDETTLCKIRGKVQQRTVGCSLFGNQRQLRQVEGNSLGCIG